MSATARFLSLSPDETRALGRGLGALLERGDCVALLGPLGAGKTVFVRGLAEGAGVAAEEVSSPTFAIVQPYSGRCVLQHADLYRIDSAAELYATGFWELREEGATVVEWADRVPEVLASANLAVALRDDRVSGGRILDATAHDPRGESLLRAWTQAQSQ